MAARLLLVRVHRLGVGENLVFAEPGQHVVIAQHEDRIAEEVAEQQRPDRRPLSRLTAPERAYDQKVPGSRVVWRLLWSLGPEARGSDAVEGAVSE